MGRNLLLNLTDHEIAALGFDKDSAKVKQALVGLKGKAASSATRNIGNFIKQLKRPRNVLLLVPAGPIVDQVIAELRPHLQRDDLIIDAGNSQFKDTERRELALGKNGLLFFGMGVSGGELGARLGPSLMPGGKKQAYNRVAQILKSIAAQAQGKPCVTYLGPGASGHYVKMVHNGIEYGLMQLIAESYSLIKAMLMRHSFNDQFFNDECNRIFTQWNETPELKSYLLEITSRVFLKMDDKTEKRLIDVIRAVAKENGTGKWTCQEAMELQIPLPTINAAVVARDLSSYEEDRKKVNSTLDGPEENFNLALSVNTSNFLDQLRNAYYASSIITFAQGMAMLQKAKSQHKYQYSLESIAEIWRGGCIIRAALLEPIAAAYRTNPKLSNLLLDPYLGSEVARMQGDLRAIVRMASELGCSSPALMASLSYYDGYRSVWLPENLVQAQRDYFGAHTYERVDRSGTFHTNWT
ncbi:unnamed protein product [Sphagnum jensenii]|uniref:6-phosphogluconate dehydrogenase, decarboxylating n=1 Tax=Sphagnum jensenii TaxID=128206 RepID=A0ABP0VEU0_9BRYO